MLGDNELSERAFEVLRLLDLSKNYHDPNTERSHISGLEHGLRLATLLERRSQEPYVVFAGLVHDLARPLNDVYHGEIIAEIVRDRVPVHVYHILRTHGLYQEAIMHKLSNPINSLEVQAACKPYHLQKLALMFAACEELSFDPNFTYNETDSWNEDRAKKIIINILN